MKKILCVIAALQLFMFVGCGSAKQDYVKKYSAIKWESLFDGKTLNGWHGFNKGSQPVANWIIEDGALVCLGVAKGQPDGSLVTDKQYDNFVLEWEWKIDSGSNSGVFYHVVEDKKYRGPQNTGPEYQIIDDENFPMKLEEWQKTGADYAMHLPNETKRLKKQGEWNTSCIVYDKGKVEHYLNGSKILEFVVGTDDWVKKRESGKWNKFPDYAKVKRGAISLQDHNSKAYFKNIRIKELK